MRFPELPDADPGPRRLEWGLPGLGRLAGWRGELCLLGFFALATLVLTWPVAITLDLATGLRGDYFNNVWNAWWLKHALAEGSWPWWTDHLYWPEGISLTRHTLSPVNALLGACFQTFLSPHAAFDAVMLVHLWLSAWTFSLLARYVTGSTPGAVLGGLLYSFAPFHLYYVCQINVFTFELVPLALLFLLRFHAEARRRDLVGFGLAMVGVAASAEYYVMYVYLLLGLLLVAGRLQAPSVGLARGARRLVAAGAVGAAGVVLGAWPLVWSLLGPEASLERAITASDQAQGRRENDLLGYYWLGGPEEVVVSWPTMLGYGTLLLLLIGHRAVLRQRFWWLVALVFFVLGLGADLDVARHSTGVPLPFALFKEVPGLSLLRKADRFFFLLQLAVALLAAAAWGALAARVAAGGRRWLATLGVAGLLMAELNAVPFRRYDYRTPAWYEELAGDATVESILEVPPEVLDVINARMLLGQVVHGKKIPLGYTTSMALTNVQEKRMLEVINYFWQFMNSQGEGRHFPDMVRGIGLDRIVLRKTTPVSRDPDPRIHERVLWAPFAFVRRPLMDVRQSGRYVDQPQEERRVDFLRLILSRAFGVPIHEDDEVSVFAVEERPR